MFKVSMIVIGVLTVLVTLVLMTMPGNVRDARAVFGFGMAPAPAAAPEESEFISGMDVSGVMRVKACASFLAALPEDVHRDLAHGRVYVGPQFERLPFEDQQTLARGFACDSPSTPRYVIIDSRTRRRLAIFNGSILTSRQF